MTDHGKTNDQLIAELATLRRRLAELETGQGISEASDDFVPPRDPRWHSLVANTPVFILILDRNQQIRFINRTNPSSTLADVNGRVPGDFMLPQYLDRAKNAIQRVFDTGKPESFEAPNYCADGQAYWYASHVGPIFSDAEVIAVSVIAEDITARKQAEQERDRANAILNAAIECLPFTFFALGPDGRYMLVNEVGRQSYADSLGKTPEEICPNEQDLTVWLENNRRAFAGERVEGEVELTVDGEKRHLYNVVTPIRDEHEFYGILGVNVDITDRVRAEEALQKAHDELERRVQTRTAELTEANERLRTEAEERRSAEEALRESEEKYRRLVEASPDAVVMCDLEGRVLFASRQAVRLSGADDAEEMYGRNAIDFVAEEERPRLEANLARLLQEGLRQGNEYMLLRKDGRRIPAEASSAVIRDADDCPKAFVAVFRDVTERKRAEKALQRERRTLLYMLRASDHERQTIAYDIHDGLAQQLAAAIMQFQTHENLRERFPEKALTAYDAGVEMVQQAHSEARRLISGVRPPALDEAGVAVAIAHLVHEKRGPNAPRIEYQDDVQFARLPPILENAVYRMAHEAVTNVCQHSRSKKAKVSLVQDGSSLRLEVQDWGVGFDPESVPDDRFGLAGIKERTRLLGGECSIESGPGEGTCVRVVLPILHED